MKARVVFIMGMLLALVGHGAYAQQIGDVLKGLQKGVGRGSTVSNTDIVNGLKEALQIGTIGPFRTLCRGLHL